MRSRSMTHNWWLQSFLNFMDRSLCRQGEDSLVGQFGRIGDGGTHGFRRQTRIIGDDLLDAQSVCQDYPE
jgi:hypothetical protein